MLVKHTLAMVFIILLISGCQNKVEQQQVSGKVGVPAGIKQWVTTERLNRRTCPDSSCGVVGQLFFRESVTVLEEQNGWVRISKYYNASCTNGNSEYVETGNAACTEANGVKNGQFAEWVSMKYLSKIRPKDPSENATGNYALVKNSDDYTRHKAAFAKAATNLIQQGRCTAGDFEEMGGWTKSMSHKNEPIYFTYCGGFQRSNRIYLNAYTGKVFSG